MEKKFNFIYITTNILTNKQYVGSHSTNNINDGYIGSGRYFLRAVKKIGKENFRREILQEYDDAISARSSEGYFIKLHDTLYPNGYNISPMGGIGFKGAEQSSITKEKQSVWQKGKTYVELYGIDKANAMKEKQRQKKLGITTNRRDKKLKDYLIEIYGNEEGMVRYESWVSKQRNAKIGKIQSKETIERRKKSMGAPWNKGKTYLNHPRTKEQINYMRSQMKLSFYKRLDMNKVEIIKNNHSTSSYAEMTRLTGYSINKLKRIIEEKLWETSESSLSQ